jgi:hydrogenase maturation protein HypF
MTAVAAGPAGAVRRRIRVRGLVQGVGFRPYIYRLAQRQGLGGYVLNDGDGVLIEVEGPGLDAFEAALRAELPPLARIDSLHSRGIDGHGERAFAIRSTRGTGAVRAAIPADVALCEVCLAELFDPRDRRYLHPFIACSHCGPRHSMSRRLPYDRASTSMADFAMCARCRHEYADPASRRFHAEPIACHDCGPRLSQEPARIAAVLGAGGIVALKGIGGYHLLCDARDAAAVDRLRRRKRRDAKPFAVLVANLASAERHARLSKASMAALTGPQRPVVVLPQRAPAGLALDDIAPGLDSIGLVLPYTGVHYLVLHALLGGPADTGWLDAAQDIALVMTSANLSGDPILTRNADAHALLADVADLIVHHDREICHPVDDSVLRCETEAPRAIRRARGYVPEPLRLSRAGVPVLACGAHLKNTVTLTRGALAFVSNHVGDLDTPATRHYQADCVEELLRLVDVRPARVACDRHPDYASTRLAEGLAERFAAPLVRVQHHHAHIAAVLAEHGIDTPCLGVALDGHGLGDHGAAWGGELLLVDGAGFQRLGHLAPLPVPGGDRAAREPWRMAAAAMAVIGRADAIAARFADRPLAGPLADLLAQQRQPQTTAAGRLFDAATGMLGLCPLAAYEGQAAMLLEALVSSPEAIDSGFVLRDEVLDFSPLLAVLPDRKLVLVHRVDTDREFSITWPEIKALMEMIAEAWGPPE